MLAVQAQPLFPGLLLTLRKLYIPLHPNFPAGSSSVLNWHTVWAARWLILHGAPAVVTLGIPLPEMGPTPG